jgi:superfamily II DNA or RNA helicase
MDHFVAKPRRSKRAPGKATTFPVFYSLDETRCLVPKYLYLRNKTKIRNETDSVCFRGLDLDRPIEFKGSLRDEQIPGVNAAVEMLRKWRGAIIRGKCGSGKTVIGVYLLARLGSRRSVVLVDQNHVAEQWAEEITRFLPQARISFVMPKATQNRIRKKIGIEGEAPSNVDFSGNIVIVMAQTAFKHLNPANPVECGLLVVDEAHKFSANSFIRSIFNFCFSYSVGLTATDERPDRLSWIFKYTLGPNVVEVEGRRMSPFVLLVDTPLQARISEEDHKIFFCQNLYKTMTKSRCRDFCALDGKCEWQGTGNSIHYNDMWHALVEDPLYREGLLYLIRALYENGRQALIFSKFKAHLEDLRNESVRRGIPEEMTSLFFGGMEKTSCLAKQMTFTTYKNTEHAINAPHKDAALFCMPINRVEQVGGRIERYVEGKSRPILIDPIIRGTETFVHQHQNHVKFYRSRGYEIVQCDPGDAARWIAQVRQACSGTSR